ncbi:MAG: ykoV 2 [Planctomycetaceae bacterium]|nr:ykoV 2 [Planctomycetaceae bacterium]
MPSHASWKGHLKISLASIPVQAFTAAEGSNSSEIALHQLHKTCKSRIQYKKVCPIHGAVANEEIVSGYEYAHGQYAILGKDELDALGAEMEKSLAIDCFVNSEAIDPLYAAGQTYYLIPDGRAGEKPYALIRDCLAAENLHGVGEMVISRKQHLVRLRPADRLLVLDMLHYEGEVRQPARYEDEIRNTTVSAAELKLTSSLIEQMTQSQFDISQYADDYMERVKELIETKVKGKKILQPHTDEEPDVINFFDALKQSVKQTQSKKKSVAAPAKPKGSVSKAVASVASRSRKKKTNKMA